MKLSRGFSSATLLAGTLLTLLGIGIVLVAGYSLVTREQADTFVAAPDTIAPVADAPPVGSAPTSQPQPQPTAAQAQLKSVSDAPAQSKTPGSVAVKETHTADIVVQYTSVPLGSQVQLYQQKTDERADAGSYADTLIQNSTSGLHTIYVRECSPPGAYYVRMMKEGALMAQSAAFQFAGTAHMDPRCSGKSFNSAAELEAAMPAQPMCALQTSKETYARGEGVVFSWTSTNATYAAFDVPNSEPINLPVEKLAASGSVTVQPQNYAGHAYALLRVYSDGAQGYCRKDFDIKAI